MPLDSVLVALINESTLANAPAHRRAASVILDWLRCSRSLDALPEALTSAHVQREVRDHVIYLMERHGLPHESGSGPR